MTKHLVHCLTFVFHRNPWLLVGSTAHWAFLSNSTPHQNKTRPGKNHLVINTNPCELWALQLLLWDMYNSVYLRMCLESKIFNNVSVTYRDMYSIVASVSRYLLYPQTLTNTHLYHNWKGEKLNMATRWQWASCSQKEKELQAQISVSTSFISAYFNWVWSFCCSLEGCSLIKSFVLLWRISPLSPLGPSETSLLASHKWQPSSTWRG